MRINIRDYIVCMSAVAGFRVRPLRRTCARVLSRVVAFRWISFPEFVRSIIVARLPREWEWKEREGGGKVEVWNEE